MYVSHFMQHLLLLPLLLLFKCLNGRLFWSYPIIKRRLSNPQMIRQCSIGDHSSLPTKHAVPAIKLLYWPR